MTRILAALALSTAIAAPAAAFDLEAMTDAERDAFRAEIRAYLLDNPEVLMEAIGVLEQREAEAQVAADEAMVAANLEAITDDGYSWVGGNPDGDITLVEFTDYRCGYCRRAHAEVEQLLSADGNIRFIIKEFPILGEGSVLSARFAIAVKNLHGDDAYKEAHDALITLRADATPESLERLAEALGHDAGEVFAEMESPAVSEVIDQNRALASALQISGTPTFVLGNRMLRGYVPAAQMQSLVDAERSEG